VHRSIEGGIQSHAVAKRNLDAELQLVLIDLLLRKGASPERDCQEKDAEAKAANRPESHGAGTSRWLIMTVKQSVHRAEACRQFVSSRTQKR
jgi:hypothetical protein